MRRRPRWYAEHVEVPLGRKRAPVVSVWTDDGRPAELGAPPSYRTGEVDDAHLTRLVAEAIAVLEARLARGEPGANVVMDVIRGLFGTTGVDATDVARVSHPVTPSDVMPELLADPGRIDRIVAAVLAIVEGGPH